MLGKNCTIYLLYNLKSKSQKYPSIYIHRSAVQTIKTLFIHGKTSTTFPSGSVCPPLDAGKRRERHTSQQCYLSVGEWGLGGG